MNKEQQWYFDRVPSEMPRHRVMIEKPFWFGTYQVTQAEYEKVMGVNPSAFNARQMNASVFEPPLPDGEEKRRIINAEKAAGKDTSRHPVETVDWDEATEFCRRLSAMAGERASWRVYRLPTEAEWEYSCRAGTTTRWYCGEEPAGLIDAAWFGGNSGAMTHPVGQKKPNAWGLYDMHGNVYQWCADWFGEDYYRQSLPSDPTGPVTGSSRLLRGGSWMYSPAFCRAAFRQRLSTTFRFSDFGFRVSLVLPDRAVEPAKLSGTADATQASTPEKAQGAVAVARPSAEETLPLNRLVDILPKVDLDRDTVNGAWTKNGVSIANAACGSRIMLPVQVEGEYDLRATFTRQEGDDIFIQLPVGSHDCTLCLGCWRGDVHGLATIDGRDANNNPTTRRPGKLNNGEQYSVFVKVRLPSQAASVEVLLGDEQIIQWQGNENVLASPQRTAISQKQQFALLVNDTKATFHSVQLRMISGKASWTTSAKTPGPVFPPGPQHEREVALWVLSAGGGLDIELADGSIHGNVKSLPAEPFWVSSLWVGKSEIVDRDLKRLRGLERLKKIGLIGASTTDETLKVLSELPSLEDVSIWSRAYTDEGLKRLGRLKKLRFLGFEGTQLTDDALASFSDLEDVTFLQFGFTFVKGPGLVHLAKMNKVDHLWLYNTPTDDAGLAFLPEFKGLTAIHLGATRITDAGLEHLRRFTGLRELMVEKTKVSGKGLLRLHEALPNCTFHADPPAMEEYCTLVLPKEPNNAELHKQRAELLARYHHKWAEAAEDLAKVIGLQPDDIDSWHHRTMLLVQLQHKDLLSEHLGKMLAQFQGGGCVLHSLTTFPTGKPELIQGGEILADKFGEDPHWRWLVAFARYRAGKYKEAESLLREWT